jgi:hypothetical protein
MALWHIDSDFRDLFSVQFSRKRSRKKDIICHSAIQKILQISNPHQCSLSCHYPLVFIPLCFIFESDARPEPVIHRLSPHPLRPVPAMQLLVSVRKERDVSLPLRTTSRAFPAGQFVRFSSHLQKHTRSAKTTPPYRSPSGGSR